MIDGYQNSTHTQIQFRRALETCDPHDVHLGVSKIIYLNKILQKLNNLILGKYCESVMVVWKK